MERFISKMNQSSAERATYSVKEAAQVLGIHYLTVYELVREGSLPVMRAGKRILIPRLALHRLIEQAAPNSTVPEIGVA